MKEQITEERLMWEAVEANREADKELLNWIRKRYSVSLEQVEFLRVACKTVQYMQDQGYEKEYENPESMYFLGGYDCCEDCG